MLISTRGMARGFTLIEILVVMIIVSVLTFVAIPNIGRQVSTYQQQQFMLTAYRELRFAESYSVIHLSTLGFGCADNNCRFYEFSNGRWQAIVHNRRLADISLEASYGHVQLKAFPQMDEALAMPTVIVRSDGLISLFSLRLGDELPFQISNTETLGLHYVQGDH